MKALMALMVLALPLAAQQPDSTHTDSTAVWSVTTDNYYTRVVTDTVWDTVTVSPPDSTPEDTTTPPPSAGCPTTGYLRLVSVSTASQLSAAISGAQPGDQIRMANGNYVGRFRLTADGTQANPITLCGDSTAVLNDNTGGGYTFAPDGANWWVFRGFVIHGGEKTIMSDNSHDNIYEYLTVRQSDGECVHMRTNSSRNIIRNNFIHHCGVEDKNGEGIYFGSGSSTGDQANDNQALNNRIEDTSSDAIDLKEYTRRSIVRGNVIRRSGTGTCNLSGGACGSQNAHAAITGRPGNAVIECNDIVPAAVLNGRIIQIYSGGAAGDGDNNVIRWNKTGSVSIHSSQVGNTQTANTPAGYAANC